MKGSGSHILPADVIDWARSNGRFVSLAHVRVGDLMNYPPTGPSSKHPDGTPGHTMIVTGVAVVDGKRVITAIGGNEITPDKVGRVFEYERDLEPGTTFVDPYPDRASPSA
jgi:hypothetical protein